MLDLANRNFDKVLLTLVLMVACIGVVAVYNSSSVFALENYGDSTRFLRLHLLYLGLGITVMFAFMHVKPEFLRKLVYPGYMLGLVLLILVLVPEIGREIGGSRRWMSVWGFSFQPSEFCKYMLVIYIAHFLAKKSDRMDSFRVGILSPMIAGGLYVLLIFAEPDLGTASLAFMVLFVMLFIGNSSVKHLFTVGVVSVLLATLAILSESYRMRRIMSFLDPWQDPLGSGYQSVQSFMAFGLGGMYGSGLGNSSQKLLFLPQSHTDFIFSIIGEEFGFIGVTLLILLFLVILARCVRISVRSQDLFSMYVVFGFTSLVMIQAALNMGVAVGLFPTTGLTLPFVSYGGSSLVCTFAAFGIILSVSRFADEKRAERT